MAARMQEIVTPLYPSGLAPLTDSKGVEYGAFDIIPKGKIVEFDMDKPDAEKLAKRGHIRDPKDDDGGVFAIGDATTEEDLLEQKKAILTNLVADTGEYDGEKAIERLNKKQLVKWLCEHFSIEEG